MSFPTGSLYAYYEPKNWGYSDGDTINTTTKKFQDDSGNARHLNSAVTGSPTYKTGGVNGLQYVRFSGTSQAVHGSAVGDSDGGTVAMVVVPQALPGGSNALFSFNDNGTHNGPQIYYDGTHYSYLWSAALEAIALQWLDEEGGLSRANGQRLRDAVLSRGGVVDPIALRSITGREPSVGPCSNGAAWRVNRGDWKRTSIRRTSRRF